MADLRRPQIKTVVLASLEVVADLPTDPEKSNFKMFTNFHKHVFLTTLKGKLNALPYYMNDGSENYFAYYDIRVKPDSTDDWETVKDCIDWIVKYQETIYL